jgi:hypothetical protein
MAEKKNNAWRPKKYEDREPTAFSCGIPVHFKDTFKRLTELSSVDDNASLRKYCQDVEGEDFDKKGQGKFSIYVRWILTTHIINNFHKLNK